MDNQAFISLANEHRRHILTALLSQSKVHPLSAYSDTGNGRDPDQLRAELYHRHLPMLDNEGYVEWDREEDTVRPGPAFEEIRPLVSFVEGKQSITR